MFAAALLMPRSLLVKHLKQMTRSGFSEDDIAALAKRFQVSEEAMRYRLINLNVLV